MRDFTVVRQYARGASKAVKNMLTIKKAEFIKSAPGAGELLRDGRPQTAFAGRSNVGKSSLINCLLNRRSLARTSKTPGRTREINYFRVNDAFYFVDLPGYGYANVPLDVRDSWKGLVEAYLKDNASLRLALLLVDSRRGPAAEERMLAEALLAGGNPYLVILTKCDKLGRQERLAKQKEACAAMGLPPGDILNFSSQTREGRESLLERIGLAMDIGAAGPKAAV